jgi:subtilase family serine protease
MSRRSWSIGGFGVTAALVATSLAATTGSAGAAPKAGETRLARSVAAWAQRGRVLRELPANRQLTVRVWLTPDVAAATAFAVAVSTPGTTAYRRYLTPGSYTSRFGPSRAEATAVEDWLRAEGFRSVSIDPQRADVAGTASTLVVQRAFRVREDVYAPTAGASAGRYPLYSNDRNLSLPSAWAGGVLGVTGLDNAAPMSTLERSLRSPGPTGATPRPATATSGAATCSSYYGQDRVYDLPAKEGITHFPLTVCGYSATQLRAAYGANRVNTGKGVTIALIEDGLAPDMFQTLADYAALERMPTPLASRYEELALGRGSQCGDPFAVEEQLDVEAAYDMAYQAHLLVVGANSCNQVQGGLGAIFAADQQVLDGNGRAPLASIVSNSWENPAGELQSTNDTDIEHAFLLRAAAEGVSEFFSSGDQTGVYAPSDDPFATGVGGTSLGVGATDNRMFETGWSTPGWDLVHGAWQFAGSQGAAGGGVSDEWSEPKYQIGVVPPRLSGSSGEGSFRVIPDISADADPFTGMLVGTLYGPHQSFLAFDVGGTSEASPLVAGMVAAAAQGQPEPFGFINPVLYGLAGTSAFHDTLPLTASSRAVFRGVVCLPTSEYCEGDSADLLALFDRQGAAFTSQVTLNGYDDMSGIGTPDGQTFIASLRRP